MNLLLIISITKTQFPSFRIAYSRQNLDLVLRIFLYRWLALGISISDLHHLDLHCIQSLQHFFLSIFYLRYCFSIFSYYRVLICEISVVSKTIRYAFLIYMSFLHEQKYISVAVIFCSQFTRMLFATCRNNF